LLHPKGVRNDGQCPECGNYGHRIFANQNSIEFTSLSWLFECLLKDGTMLLFFEHKRTKFQQQKKKHF
jgi:hypothetical protein